RPTDHHPAPVPRPLVALLDHPDSDELVLTRALGAFGDSMPDPLGLGQRRRQLRHRHRSRRVSGGKLACPRSPQLPLPLGYLPVRLAAPDLGVVADLEAVPLVLLLDRLPEIVAVAIQGVARDPLVAQMSSTPGSLQHLGAQLDLGPKAQ